MICLNNRIRGIGKFQTTRKSQATLISNCSRVIVVEYVTVTDTLLSTTLIRIRRSYETFIASIQGVPIKRDHLNICFIYDRMKQLFRTKVNYFKRHV